jgi:predicted transcriptional regulator of viral defense system
LKKQVSFFNICPRNKMSQAITDKILQRIRGHGKGWVFTPTDLADLADPRVVGVILGRLVERGHIRRLARGIYDYPKEHPKLGLLSPLPEAIAHAVAGNRKTRVQPSGAYAANILQLSEQVPARIVFLTDGQSRLVKIGNMELRFRKTAPRNFVADPTSATVIQALRHLGQRHITPTRIATLRRVLPLEARQRLRQDLSLAPAWMRPHLQAVAEDNADA